MGLQPYTILVIEDLEMRERIKPLANGQPQIVEGSHVLVFAAWDKLDEKRVKKYVESVAATRGVPPASLEAYKTKILKKAGGMDPEAMFQWNARQMYIALGMAITAAAAERVDATPMEGFDPTALDALLDLREQGLRSVALLALGYRDPERDAMASARKVRRDRSELFVTVP
jgi:nitroreductase